MTGVLVLAGVLGLAVGSFLNVVVWRVPRGASVVAPPSACPRCGARIRPWDNVPLVSWLVLRGRCRDCAAPISVRYPVVEAATGTLFVLTTLRFGVAPELLAYLYVAAVGIALALIDLDVHRLPDRIVLPSYGVLAVLLLVGSWGSGDLTALGRAAMGGVALWLLYFLLALAKPGAMGFGDVKLAGLLGAALAWVGWGALVVGAFAAFLLGGLYGVAMMVAGRATRRSRVPFGPWMVLGAFVGVGFGESIWSAYLGLVL